MATAHLDGLFARCAEATLLIRDARDSGQVDVVSKEQASVIIANLICVAGNAVNALAKNDVKARMGTLIKRINAIGLREHDFDRVVTVLGTVFAEFGSTWKMQDYSAIFNYFTTDEWELILAPLHASFR